MDEGRGGGEADREALLAGCQPEPQRDVGLAGAAVAERDDILAAGDVLRAGQLQHQGLVERGDGGEVEAVEALDRWELRLLDPALDGPPFPLDHLQLGQTQQVAGGKCCNFENGDGGRPERSWAARFQAARSNSWSMNWPVLFYFPLKRRQS